MDDSAPAIAVEVVYALPERQIVRRLEVSAGTTVQRALEASGLLQEFPEIPGERLDVGIYGKRVDRSTVLQEFDRIEIYRPLIADPKQARRARTGRKKLAR
jgi:putative ubiquitin-RnfH superfamily antitoxin RatB of RatAB toxin-antitoxin module